MSHGKTVVIDFEPFAQEELNLDTKVKDSKAMETKNGVHNCHTATALVFDNFVESSMSGVP